MRNAWLLDKYHMINYLIKLNKYLHTSTLRFILPGERRGACTSHSHIRVFMQVSAHAQSDGCGEQRSASGVFPQEAWPVFFLEIGSLSSLKSAKLFEDG